MATRLNGVSPEIADHVGNVLKDAAELLRRHKISRTEQLDSAGRITVTEAIRRAGKFPLSGENKGGLKMFQDLLGAEVFQFDLEEDLAVKALAQYLVFARWVTPLSTDSNLEVIERFSSERLDFVVRQVVSSVATELIKQGAE